MMELQNIHLEVDETNILSQINFRWSPGESVALLGANGAGKSSFLKVISGLTVPSSGKVSYPSGLDLKQWQKSLGVVFQSIFLYDALTAYENLQFYQKLYGNPDNDRIELLLHQVGLLSVRRNFVASFSKGMKQRLSIARALIHQPDYLLLDEPFDGLDWASKNILEELLGQMKQNGTGYILVSHDSNHAWQLCDRALLLDEGAIVLDVPCTEEGYFLFMDKYRNLSMGNHYDFS